jgi:hypothetical protein
MQQQPMSLKPGCNLFLLLCIAHQRCLVVPMRNFFGMHALGMPSILGLLLMLIWSALSEDPVMFVWMAAWGICFAHRCMQSLRMEREGAKVHSQYDGWPFETIKMGKTENTSKLVVEPLMVVIIGAILVVIYKEFHLNMKGLPLFFLLGGFTLPVIEMIKQSIWKKRTQEMMDAQIENEAAVREFREKFGAF